MKRKPIAVLHRTGMYYAQVSNLIRIEDESWGPITKNLSICAKEAFKRFYDPHFRVDDEVYKVLNLTRMIGKCKAIAHGSTALDYIFREGKIDSRLAFPQSLQQGTKDYL